MRTREEMAHFLEKLNPLYHCGEQRELFSEEERDEYFDLLHEFFSKRREAISALHAAEDWDKLNQIGIFPDRDGTSRVITRDGSVY